MTYSYLKYIFARNIILETPCGIHFYLLFLWSMVIQQVTTYNFKALMILNGYGSDMLKGGCLLLGDRVAPESSYEESNEAPYHHFFGGKVMF